MGDPLFWVCSYAFELSPVSLASPKSQIFGISLCIRIFSSFKSLWIISSVKSDSKYPSTIYENKTIFS